MSQPVTDSATQQALAELVQRAHEQMVWEAGFRARYHKQLESIEFVRMMSCTEITIQAHEEIAAAYRVVADALKIDLSDFTPTPTS